MHCVVIEMAKHHTDLRPYRIYALVLGEDFFVGKTASPRIAAVYSRHRCGTVVATQETMDLEEAPSLYILEELNCTGAEAYQHVLAWLCRFEEASYCTVNHTATALASENLYPPAKALFNKLMLEPMDQILARTYVPKPSDANRKPSRIRSILPDPQKTVQMNLRMPESDKRAFDRYCKKNRLKAREGLGLLMDQLTGDSSHLNELLAEVKALRRENDHLKERLAVLRGETLPGSEQKAHAYLQFLKPGIQRYIQQLYPSTENASLPTFPYKQFRKQTGIRCEYPESEGFLVLTAEAMLWGHHRARFVVGRDQEGKWLKVRYYPKPVYMGSVIWEYPKGTRWLLGCLRASDGAMEIASAFPLPLTWGLTGAKSTVQNERWASLDEQIFEAQRKT